MRVEGVILKDHGNITVFWLQMSDIRCSDMNTTVTYIFQTAIIFRVVDFRTRRADENEKLAFSDFKIDVVDRTKLSNRL